MKTTIQRKIERLIFLVSGIIFSATRLSAQCNVNDKYDKIISGYHSSIALKTNGVYSVWGSYMSSTGASDVLSPQDINTTNYAALTGTVLKAALGGKNGASQVDQGILLTTTGLWAWGIEGNVFNNSLTTSAAFQRIISPTGATTMGLPTGLVPADVASMFATYQTLTLLTTTGNVWILTQTSLALEANGGTATSAGSSTWKQVKINSTTNLTNVVAVRGQVSNITYNAFVALTATGQVYTWGNSTYLGNAAASSAKNYATLMTLPSEFTSSNIPKMIGVTGGIGITNTTKNTYYLLGTSGKLYTLGDNTQKQCGDFTTTERLSWVNAKINSTTNFTNINFFSVQEHTSAYPAAVAVTTSGDLYTWGNDNNSMIGRTDNGTSTGTVSGSYDPGMPVIFTSSSDKAIFAELGGHTLVYLKEGSSQYCYVGHKTDGSMGDGTATASTLGAGSYYASCSSTPSLNICGSVPVAASSSNSIISSSASSILANGSSVATITIQLKNSSGVNLTSTGGSVAITTSAGTIGTVTDNNNGTYTATLTSSASITTANLAFTINGTAASSTANVNFVATLPLSWLNESAYRVNNMVKITWKTADISNVKSFDIERSLNGQDWNVVVSNIPFSAANSNTYYEQQDTSYSPQRLFYRIREQDMDGHFTYSPAFTVSAVAGIDKISIYPMPLENNFHLNTVSPGKIKRVQLLSVSGNLLKNWNQYQSTYDLKGLPAGNYILRIETSTDVQVIKLVK